MRRDGSFKLMWWHDDKPHRFFEKRDFANLALGVCYFIYYPVLSVGVGKGQLSGLVGMDIISIDVE